LIDITQLAVGVISLIFLLISAYLIPFLKNKINTERWNMLQEIAYIAVHAAEQLGFTGIITDKYKYAYDFVKIEAEKRNIVWDESVIKAAIEAAVNQYLTYDEIEIERE